MKKLLALAAVTLSLGTHSLSATAAEAAPTAENLSFSDMNRRAQVTDLVCGTELFKDTMGAQAGVPVRLCPGEDGLG